jgi:hypothetical protein
MPGLTDTWGTNGRYQGDKHHPNRKNCHDMGSASSQNANFSAIHGSTV